MQEEQANDSSELIAELSEIYGLRFLRFVLALPESWEVGDGINTQQSNAVAALLSWAQAFQEMDPPNRWINLASLATRRMVSDKESNACVLRKQCGGQMEVPQSGSDDVFAILVEYARDIYPAFLINHPEETRIPGSPFISPDQQGGDTEFYRAVLRDDQLKYLFPSELDTDPEELSLDELRRVDSLAYFEAGQGGSFQLPLFAFHLLNSAYMRCVVTGNDSYEAYIAAVARSLSDARSLAAGRTAKVPVVLGFSNISITGTESIALPGSTLRKVAPEDVIFLPPDVKVDALLVFDMPMKIAYKGRHPKGDEDDSNEAWHQASEKFRKWRESLQWTADCHRLAFMLSDRETHRSGVVQVLQIVVNPLQGNLSMSWADSDIYTLASELRIEAGSIEDITRWVGQVTSNHPRSLRVALRRILSAASSRTDPSDALVDAVLAWENIFSDSPETSLRVCGSLALLLEPSDREKRKILLRELNEIYGTRSAIVHGNAKEPTDETVRKHGDRALEVAVEAMRRLYRNPELLKSSSASARGRDVLLGLVEIY
ncbi:hypothetical protein ACFV1V_15890 [Streptomyces globisporus]|uniref:hypothetical protein n=1 Tax=Streptomyces globisporus TaxID=1908 RepID=UPI003690F330